MGASLSLAVFAALVAAITVVASMTVVAAVGLLFYSSVRGEEGAAVEQGYESLTPIYDATEHGVTFREGPLPLNESIDARRLVGFFDEEDSSLSHFDPTQASAQGRRPMPPADPVYGSPEWTEEEGATEIFSAHEPEESAAAFADFENEEPTRLTGVAGGMVGAGPRTG
jgi:hypothetical protein